MILRTFSSSSSFYVILRNSWRKTLFLNFCPIISNWKAVDRDLSASTWPPLSGPISSRFGAENTKLANTESTNDRDCTWTIVPRFPRNFFLPPHMLKTLGVHLTQIHTLSLFFFLFFFLFIHGGTLEQISIYQFFHPRAQCTIALSFYWAHYTPYRSQVQFANRRISMLEIPCFRVFLSFKLNKYS